MLERAECLVVYVEATRAVYTKQISQSATSERDMVGTHTHTSHVGRWISV